MTSTFSRRAALGVLGSAVVAGTATDRLYAQEKINLRLGWTNAP
jgi:hypothetical protein